ncbi:MAG: hypothetical protein WAW92_03220, partial [Minisyncoccia bacterium]
LKPALGSRYVVADIDEFSFFGSESVEPQVPQDLTLAGRVMKHFLQTTSGTFAILPPGQTLIYPRTLHFVN